MSNKNKNNAKSAKTATVVTPSGNVPPSNLPEELLPVYDWYKAKGRDFLLTVAIALIAVVAVFAYKNFRLRQNQEASAALLTATDTQGLENISEQFGKTALGPAIRIRLAKSYYTDGNYKSAVNTCDLFLNKNRNHELAPEAGLCRAASLEALEEWDEAIAAYSELAKDERSFVAPYATLGLARCFAAKGDKDKANALLDDLALAKKGTKWDSEVEELRGVIARFEGFKNVSLFDRLADTPAASEPSGEIVPAVPAAEEIVPAVPAAEEIAPAAEKPQETEASADKESADETEKAPAPAGK